MLTLLMGIFYVVSGKGEKELTMHKAGRKRRQQTTCFLGGELLRCGLTGTVGLQLAVGLFLSLLLAAGGFW